MMIVDGTFVSLRRFVVVIVLVFFVCCCYLLFIVVFVENLRFLEDETEEKLRSLSITKPASRQSVSLHPILDPRLNRNFHYNYSSYFTDSVRRFPFINRNFRLLLDMSGARHKPLLCSAEENSRSAREIVESQFVETALQAQGQKNRNLVESLRTSMLEIGLESEKIEATLASFDSTATISDYETRNKNSHLIKAKAFSSYASFRAFCEDHQGERKAWEMTLDAWTLAANIKANDNLYTDSARELYLTNLRKWVTLNERADLASVATSADMDVGDAQTLLTISQNVLKNATLRLASEEQLVTQSLADYAEGKEMLPKRIFPKQTTARFLKILASSKPLDLDLQRPESCDIPLAFNCNHCPSLARKVKVSASKSARQRKSRSKKRKNHRDQDANDATDVEDENEDDDDNDDDNNDDNRRRFVSNDDNNRDNDEPATKRQKLVFVTPALGEFNILKAVPIDNLDDFLRHNAQVHRIGEPNLVAKTGAHSFCILCRLCDALSIKNAFVCCLGTLWVRGIRRGVG